MKTANERLAETVSAFDIFVNEMDEIMDLQSMRGFTQGTLPRSSRGGLRLTSETATQLSAHYQSLGYVVTVMQKGFDFRIMVSWGGPITTPQSE